MGPHPSRCCLHAGSCSYGLRETFRVKDLVVFATGRFALKREHMLLQFQAGSEGVGK